MPAAPQVGAALDRSRDSQEVAQACAAGTTAPPPYDPVRNRHCRTGCQRLQEVAYLSCASHANQRAGPSSRRPPPPPAYDPMAEVGQLMKPGPSCGHYSRHHSCLRLLTAMWRRAGWWENSSSIAAVVDSLDASLAKQVIVGIAARQLAHAPSKWCTT